MVKSRVYCQPARANRWLERYGEDRLPNVTTNHKAATPGRDVANASSGSTPCIPRIGLVVQAPRRLLVSQRMMETPCQVAARPLSGGLNDAPPSPRGASHSSSGTCLEVPDLVLRDHFPSFTNRPLCLASRRFHGSCWQGFGSLCRLQIPSVLAQRTPRGCHHP